MYRTIPIALFVIAVLLATLSATGLAQVSGLAFSSSSGTYTPIGGGTIQRLPTAGPYLYGSAARLIAVPNAGNYFRFWGGAASGISISTTPR